MPLMPSTGASLVKTALAILYFNPIWIARHLLFIKLFSGQLDAIGWHIFEIALWSFLANILISFISKKTLH